MPVIDLSEHIKVKGYTILPLAASFIDAKALLVKMEPQHPRWDWLERIIFDKAEPVDHIGAIEEFWKNVASFICKLPFLKINRIKI